MKTNMASRKACRQFLPYMRVTLILGFEGIGINGNTTEDPKRLLELIDKNPVLSVTLGRHANRRDSVKLKDAQVVSLQVCNRTKEVRPC